MIKLRAYPDGCVLDEWIFVADAGAHLQDFRFSGAALFEFINSRNLR